jgi:peptidylprolyl isomerase
MGRANELDSGGTELYIVNGGAQRYLDRNVTIFGRIIDGMSHIQALKRGNDINGAIDLTGQNIIKSIRVAVDMPAAEVLPIEVLDSGSESFAQLLKARKNRSGEWFVHQHDYMDACGVPIPSRLRPDQD